jgi:predicted ester cyclase
MVQQPVITSAPAKAAADNVGLVREFFVALDGKQAVPTELMAPGLTFVFNSDKPTDLAGWQGLVTMWFTAFPGSKHTVEACEAVGDHVFSRVRATGTHKGPLFGIPPSNKPIDIIGHQRFVVQDGKIARVETVWDMLSIMQQVGAVPRPS